MLLINSIFFKRHRIITGLLLLVVLAPDLLVHAADERLVLLSSEGVLDFGAGDGPGMVPEVPVVYIVQVAAHSWHSVQLSVTLLLPKPSWRLAGVVEASRLPLVRPSDQAVVRHAGKER